MSTELRAYGVTLELSNCAAACRTGLLVARLLLKKLGLAEKVTGTVKAGDEDGRRAFKVLLDVGLRRTTTGTRVFAVMKGPSTAASSSRTPTSASRRARAR